MKPNTDANRRMNKRCFFIIIGILLCMFVLSTVKTEAADDNKEVVFPEAVTGDGLAGFNGGTCPAPYSDVNNINIEKAFIGENRKSLFVAIPTGRYIQFSFPDYTNEIKTGTLTIETTGADKATGKVFAILNDNTEQELGSIRETKDTQKTTFVLDEDCLWRLKAIKIKGTNNSGQYPGLDVVSVYIEIESAVYFDAQGGVADYKSKIVAVGDTYGTLPDAQRTGYTFRGWYTEKSGGSKVTSGHVRYSGVVTLYAHWKTHKYNIKFNKNGGSGSMKNMTNLSFNKRYTLKANKYKKSGYIFKGWSTSKKGSVKYNNKASFRNMTEKDGKTVKLYAIWEKKAVRTYYTISYNANGGKGTMKPDKKRESNKTYNLKKNVFKRSGYKFIGWSVKKNGNVKYGDSAPVRNLSTKNGATVKLYAVWEKSQNTEEVEKAQKAVPKVYGCIISGCNDKENGYTLDGATDFYKKLIKNRISGYTTSSKNIRLVGVGQAAPYKYQMDEYITDTFSSTTNNDISFIYYAGHGRGGGSGGKGLGICLLDDNWSGYYSYDEFLSLLDNNIKGRVVLITDACFSSGFVEAAKKSPMKNRICVLAAAAEYQNAYSYLKHDMAEKPVLNSIIGEAYYYLIDEKLLKNNKTYLSFTYTIMNGLNWQKTKKYPADVNKDKVVTAEELSSYVNSNMPKVTSQTPNSYLGKLKNQILFSEG